MEKAGALLGNPTATELFVLPDLVFEVFSETSQTSDLIINSMFRPLDFAPDREREVWSLKQNKTKQTFSQPSYALFYYFLKQLY